MNNERAHERILVVEDDAGQARILKKRLEGVGFAVETVGDGKSALLHAAEDCPDLVILDLRLPGMDGYQVCQELRRIQQPWAIPVLMLTAMDTPLNQIHGFTVGADAYLTKPYDPEELLRTIAVLLGKFYANAP